ncbi:MAG: DUF3737 family protein [Clostridia bacterium]|nr:DUF3737 family protein [Clostridia bacterium]
MKQSEYIKIEGKRFGEERALYASRGVYVKNCAFDGPEDGESALKESSCVLVEDTFCNLRYPFWHDTTLELKNCQLTELCRAALWYSEEIQISDSRLHGIKALRECANVSITDTDVRSAEFGWMTRGVSLTRVTAEGEYFFFRGADLVARELNFRGKYSFQYVENARFEDCVLDTKDAFWHAKNVTVRNCVVKGEYLAWYSDGLTLENCKIIGTQPLCYCTNLKLINCEMIDTDLAFERSHVEATLTAPLISIKNPYSGSITAPSAELILDDPAAKCHIHFTDPSLA